MKKALLFLLSVIMLTLFSSCAIPKNEPDIIADISSYNLSYFTDTDFSSYEITQRNTYETTDEIFVTLTNGDNSYDFKAIYNYTRENGWKLTQCDFLIPKNNPDLVHDVSCAKLPLTKAVSIKSVEKIKRNVQETMDEIYVNVFANGSDFSCNMHYKLVYNFYTEGGWILDYCIPINADQWHAEPTRGLSSDTIDTELQCLADYSVELDPQYDSVELISSVEDLENKKHILHFKAKYNNNFCNLERDIYYTYTFNDKSFGESYQCGWEMDYTLYKTEKKATYKNLDGNWYWYDRGNKYTFTVTTSGNTIKIKTPNNYTYSGELTPTGADVDIKSSAIHGPGSRVSFNSDGTISYISPSGFNNNMVTHSLTRENRETKQPETNIMLRNID